MQCEKCKGRLVVKNGVYVCENCGTQYLIDDYYEDIEVFICYVENDSSGRRTKDSIIAQELYQKIEAHDIKCFYSRISAGDSTGQNYEKTIVAAMNRAKIVVILGTSREYFEKMSDEYSVVYSGKIIIPVFSTMDPNDIPKNISSIQALNYDKIGSEIDLLKSLFNALGREKETEKLIGKNEGARSRKVFLYIGIVVLCISICAVCILRGRKNKEGVTEENVTGENVSLTENSDNNEKNYELAMSYISDEKYAEAIELLTKLQDYKDSNKQLQKIYNMYSGYYQDLKSGIELYFQVVDGISVEIELTYKKEGQQLTIKDSSLLEQNQVLVDYSDSEGNRGELAISIKNDGLQLVINTKNINSDLYVPSSDVRFELSGKSDKPFAKQITSDELLKIIEKKTSISELKKQGYSLYREKTIGHMEFEFRLYDIYQIENTDIELMVIYFDISNCEDPFMECLENEANNDEEKSMIIGIMAPAEILIPELMGEDNTPFVKNDILYVPDGYIENTYNPGFYFGEHYDTKLIDKNTFVCITNKSTIGEKLFQNLVDGYCDQDGYYRKKHNYDEEVIDTDTETDTEDNTEDSTEDNTPEDYDEEIPNVFCPICGAGYFRTGLGIDGFFCVCGCNWMPMCYVCGDENAYSIMIDGQFVCQLCGEGWLP